MIDKNRSDLQHIMSLTRVVDNSAINNLPAKTENRKHLKIPFKSAILNRCQPNEDPLRFPKLR